MNLNKGVRHCKTAKSWCQGLWCKRSDLIMSRRAELELLSRWFMQEKGWSYFVGIFKLNNWGLEMRESQCLDTDKRFCCQSYEDLDDKSWWFYFSRGTGIQSLLFLNLGMNQRQAFEGRSSTGINVQDSEYGHSDKEPNTFTIWFTGSITHLWFNKGQLEKQRTNSNSICLEVLV